ncbi:MerR family transcriptional regulator [Desulfosporosinus sp. BICA1-9]|uniref:MerR family transcriptional regulator n=1 Tax=Desulfosporosinus sp. BICA1-9 TaxID=1531958 RepID=UPI00054B6745|nr:MerR family transcriptional regulator [Desulfosporosinus sp. BICA1-9]KJS47486.1 MAG: hypothetical protein VR66_19420 [Peptococcaceae bacterium BRH_c23]KJS84529.1 MAG: hypothetical protein JL57_20565 [Desulfosporosinus sp. BICA1-9]
MKIRSFAKKHNVSESTVRYYMKQGLLMPNRKNKQYDFDEECSKNLENVKLLKDLDFSLAKIKSIILYQVINESFNFGNNEYFLKMFRDKREILLLERNKLDDKITKLCTKIEESKTHHSQQNKTVGVPIDFLEYLYCPTCLVPLVIIEGKIENGEINWGTLSCPCGFSARIDDGILIVDDLDKQSNRPNPEEIKMSVATNSDLNVVKLIWGTIKWCFNRYESVKVSSKIILKHDIGIGVLDIKLCSLLPEGYYYIMVEEEIEFLRDSRKNIEMNGSKAKLIYMCTKFTQVPLKNNSVDLIIDKICSPTVDLTQEKYAIEILQEKLKVGGSYLGVYLYLAGNGVPKLMKCGLSPYFKLDKIKNSLANIFTEVDCQDFGCVVLNNGENESFLQKGDKIGLWSYFGKKA